MENFNNKMRLSKGLQQKVLVDSPIARQNC